MSGNQFYRWVFTWEFPEASHVDDSIPVNTLDLQKHLIAMSAKKFNYQAEIGKKAHTLHYQGRITFKEKFVKSTLLEKFSILYDTKHLTLAPERDKVSSEAYANKEDTRVWGSDVWFPHRYLGKDLPRYLAVEPQFRWQQDLDRLVSEGSDRKIIVLQDTEGGIGKSTYIKTNCFRSTDHVLVTVMGTPISINAGLIALGPKRVYHVDLNRSYPRSSLPDTMIVLESLKNGMLASSMYGKPSVLYMDIPTVIVYTNMIIYQEDLTHLSLDRWDIRKPLVTYSGIGESSTTLQQVPICTLPNRPLPEAKSKSGKTSK